MNRPRSAAITLLMESPQHPLRSTNRPLVALPCQRGWREASLTSRLGSLVVRVPDFLPVPRGGTSRKTCRKTCRGCACDRVGQMNVSRTGPQPVNQLG
jgi:hypothetical protein